MWNPSKGHKVRVSEDLSKELEQGGGDWESQDLGVSLLYGAGVVGFHQLKKPNLRGEH